MMFFCVVSGWDEGIEWKFIADGLDHDIFQQLINNAYFES